MYQGEELKQNLVRVQSILDEYSSNMTTMASLEKQQRSELAEKVAIDTSGAGGKAKLMTMVVGGYVLVMLLLATIVYGMFSTWVGIAVAAAVAFVMWNRHKIIAIIAGAIAVFVTAEMIYVCVIATFIRAISIGNVPGILIPTLFAVILVAIVLLINRKSVEKSNEKIRQINNEIIAQNQNVITRYSSLRTRAEELDTALVKELTSNGGWYPSDFAFCDAAHFFVNYIINRKPDITMSELIDKYEQERRDRERRAFEAASLGNQQTIIRNQQQMKQQFNQLIDNTEVLKTQLQFSNMIGMYNCYQMSVLNNNVAALKSVKPVVNTNVNVTFR
jgi:hypothetical protein